MNENPDSATFLSPHFLSLLCSQDLLVVHLEEALATSNSEKSLELGAELYPFAALSSGNNSLDRLLRTLSSLGCVEHFPLV